MHWNTYSGNYPAKRLLTMHRQPWIRSVQLKFKFRAPLLTLLRHSDINVPSDFLQFHYHSAAVLMFQFVAVSMRIAQWCSMVIQAIRKVRPWVDVRQQVKQLTNYDGMLFYFTSVLNFRSWWFAHSVLWQTLCWTLRCLNFTLSVHFTVCIVRVYSTCIVHSDYNAALYGKSPTF